MTNLKIRQFFKDNCISAREIYRIALAFATLNKFNFDIKNEALKEKLWQIFGLPAEWLISPE